MARIELKLKDNQKLWFTSDFHMGHTNMCRGVSNWSDLEQSTRDFPTVHEMNKQLITNINNNVAEDDILFQLGDFSFREPSKYRYAIRCQNIYALLGNHDKDIARNEKDQKLFLRVDDYVHLIVNGKINIILCHYPIASWDGIRRGSIHLHGHCHMSHENKLGVGKMMDVGVDGHLEYRPYELSEILNIMDKQPILSLMRKGDHHI